MHNCKKFCRFTLQGKQITTFLTTKKDKMTTSTITLETRNGNATINCNVKETNQANFTDVSFSYAGFDFVLENRKAKGGLVGKSITTNSKGKNVFTWVKVSKDSEVLSLLKKAKKAGTTADFGTVEWWATGMNGE